LTLVSNDAIGVVLTTFALGADDCVTTTKVLKDAIDEFNSTLANYGHNLGFLAYKVLSGNVFVQIR